jgi:RNA polymerase sigma factor (sigma-70 family)
MPSRPVAVLREPDLLAVVDLTRRFVTSVSDDLSVVDDVVQETTVRLLENRWRIDRRTAPGYAVATARNLLAQDRRDHQLALRHRHRLVERAELPDGTAAVEQAEEQAAVAAALQQLPERDRDLLLAHHVDGRPTGDLAEGWGMSDGAVRTALARARGRLRLEYCLQAHRRELSDDRCRQVLTALALGDGARQRSVGAGRHLASCQVCPQLVDVITTRDRHTAGLGPLVVIVALLGWLRRSVSAHPVAAAAGTTTVAGGTALALVLVSTGHQHAAPARVAVPVPSVTSPTTRAVPALPEPVRTGLVMSGADVLAAAGSRDLSGLAGHDVAAVRVPVLAVDADEGFWVGTTKARMWVQLTGKGESTVTVRRGDLLDFTGRVVVNRPGFAAAAGIVRTEDSALLDRQKVHVEVPSGAVHVILAPVG